MHAHTTGGAKLPITISNATNKKDLGCQPFSLFHSYRIRTLCTHISATCILTCTSCKPRLPLHNIKTSQVNHLLQLHTFQHCLFWINLSQRHINPTGLHLSAFRRIPGVHVRWVFLCLYLSLPPTRQDLTQGLFYSRGLWVGRPDTSFGSSPASQC